MRVQHDTWTFKPGFLYLSSSLAKVAFVCNVLVYLTKLNFVAFLALYFSVAYYLGYSY